MDDTLKFKQPTDKICPLVKEPCIGKECSEFSPRYKFRGSYNVGIQDVAVMIWCWLRRVEYVEPMYIGTNGPGCNQNMRAVYRWDGMEIEDRTG